VAYTFYGLRPAVTGLIAAAVLAVFRAAVLNTALFRQTGAFSDLISLKYILFFAVIFAAIRKFKKSPILYIAISAVVGIVMKF
jgi:chromate transporter